MSEGRGFTGNATDFIDWFKGQSFEKVDLPPHKIYGAEKNALEENSFLPPIPDSLREAQGKEYALRYQEQFLNYIKDRKCVRNRKEQYYEAYGDENEVGSLSEETEEDGEQKKSVYLHYNFVTRNTETNLPIFDAKKEILGKIANYQVVIIEGETGCGKSTQVPQFILDEAVDKHQHCNIIVTQPRKIAAISLASRVCKERGWKLGKLVGYQVGLDSSRDADTRLLYVTTEILVQKLIHQRKLGAYTHIILDEVHERDQQTDFALLIVKKLMHTVSPSAKIILMSATINASKFAQYFATPVLGNLLPAPIVSAGEETIHGVQIFYMDALYDLCKKKKNLQHQRSKLDRYDPDISGDVYELAVDMIKCFDEFERTEAEIPPNETIKKRGAVLVFLPGLAEIETLVNMLVKEASKYQWQTYPLHSSITREEQQSVFFIPPVGFRKIIISTNIAESSITVPDIKYVIDFCLTKVLRCDEVTNFTSLKLAWASKSSCKQRAGRCGRVSSGRVYRLVSHKFYETFEDYTAPEMCHTPLSQVILKTKVLNMGEPHSLLALALDPPDMTDICRTILILKQMGALSVATNGCQTYLDGDLTFLGRVIATLPIDPLLAKMILMGHMFGCLRECIIIAASMSLKSFHARPFQDELNAFLSKVSWAYGSLSDCLAALNAYELWQAMRKRGEYLIPGGKSEAEWAKHSYVQLNTLEEVHKLVGELRERLKRLKIDTYSQQTMSRKDKILILKMCMAAAFYPQYYKRSTPEDYQQEICRQLSGHDPFRTVVVSGLPAETNIIYDPQIRTLFKECSQNLVISYEGSKAFIQFPYMDGSSMKEDHFQSIPGDSPTTMHLALKMRQIPRFLEKFCIDVISPQESEKQFEDIMSSINCVEKSASRGSSKFSASGKPMLTNHSVRVTQLTSNNLKPPVLPSPTNHTWDIFVTHVVSAGHFWAISNEASNVNNLKHLEQSIKSLVKDMTPLLPSVASPGSLCLAPFTDSVGRKAFYRARIENTFSPDDKLRVMVFFVDYGNTEVVDISDLKYLPKQLREVNMMAVECMLAEVKPAGKYSNESWSQDATAYMQRYALNHNFTVQIYSIVSGVLRVHLLGLEYGRFISINEQLISKGFAVHAEEFALSKQNHELRAFYSNEVKMIRQEGNTASGALSSSSFTRTKLPTSSQKIKLRGPDSPLLMKFMAITRSGGSKFAKVNNSSVNSTALDLEPQNPHDRLLVAGHVSLNQSQTTATLLNTTLMPAVPGILPLCLLLFSPVAEMRVNSTGTHYTGALIGVGRDERTGRAIYPADDIEIPFDIMIQQDDLLKINQIRLILNVVLEEAEYMSLDVLSTNQQNLRQLLLKLLDKKRIYKDPEESRFPYCWNMIPPDEILSPITGLALKDENVVFPLHNGVCLRPDNHIQEVKYKLSEIKSIYQEYVRTSSSATNVLNRNCPVCGTQLHTMKDLQEHINSTFHKKNEIKFSTH